MKSPHLTRFALPALFAPFVLVSSAWAAGGTWIQPTTGGLWGDTGNWSSGTADGSGFTADFNTLNITSDNTVHLDSIRTLGNLTFGDTTTSSAANWILDNNGSGANILTLAGGTPTITVNALGSGRNASISAEIAGSSGLTKAGIGTLAITGNSTYTGSTTISAGLFQIGNGGTTGSINSSSPVVINETGSKLGLGFNRTDTFTFANAISGAGRINQNGTGTVILTNTANSYTGSTALASGSTIRGSDATVVTGSTAISTVLGNGGTISPSNNSVIELRANGLNDSSVQTISFKNVILASTPGTNFSVNVDRENATGGTGKSLGFTGKVTLANDVVMNVTGANGFNLALGTIGVGTGNTDGSVTLNPTSANLVAASIAGNGQAGKQHIVRLDGTSTGNAVTGAITNGSGGGTLSVTKQNTGTWTLFGSSSYTGATTISGGTLALGAANGITDTSNLIMAGGTFATGGFSETLGTLSLSANSIIDLGSGASALVFADSSGTTWGSSVTLSFINFTEGADSIRIGTDAAGLSLAQLGAITINGGAAAIDARGFLTAIPEPSTWALLLGSAALAGTMVTRRTRRS